LYQADTKLRPTKKPKKNWNSLSYLGFFIASNQGKLLQLLALSLLPCFAAIVSLTTRLLEPVFNVAKSFWFPLAVFDPFK
jgi:hypothetical protein